MDATRTKPTLNAPARKSEFVAEREAVRIVNEAHGLNYAEAAFYDPRTRRRLGLKVYRVGRTRRLRFRRSDLLALLRPE
jgi:hypothetical protein